MDYIYTVKSIPKHFCEKIIHQYENESELNFHGVTSSGLNKNVKDTRDLLIPSTEIWEETNQLLSDELQKNIKVYIDHIEKKNNYKASLNHGIQYSHFHSNMSQVHNFMIQKYDKNKGKYIYHEDSAMHDNKQRVITFLWYLNDVEEGGETEFFGGSYQIKPEAGKLLFFPAVWSFPHRGNVPRSSDKYIITGWLYIEIDKLKIRSDHYIPLIKALEPEKGTNLDSISENESEKTLVFEYFYNLHRKQFIGYKESISNKTIQFPTLVLYLYTDLLCRWLIQKLEPYSTLTELDKIPEITPFVIPSFKIIVDIVKTHYQINPNFNIKKWVFLKEETLMEEIEYDLCIQTDLTTGNTHINEKMIHLETEYQIVYFIEFTFIYVDNQHEKKTLTLKEIIEPFMEYVHLV